MDAPPIAPGSRPDAPAAGSAADFDLDEVLEQACASLGDEAQQKGLEFIVHRSRDVPRMLVGDRVRLVNVLRELAGNAVKFTAAGEVSIAIDGETLDQAAGEALLRFSVTDTGIGVEDSIAARFAPGAAAAPPAPQAAGRGLAVVDEIMRSMGATVELATAAGIGSDFSFVARFGVASREVAETPALAGLRVLLVDDNDTARAALQHLLAAAGCRVTAASDGSEALDAIHAASDAPAEVLVVDTDLADKDGLEALRAVLRCLPAPHPPVIATVVPGRLDETMARAARRALCIHAFLTKPVKASELYRALGAATDAPAAATARPDGPCIDASRAREMLGGSEELLERVLADFCSAESETAAAVREMIAEGRLEEAGRRVHSAKGTAMVLGMERFVRAAANIERALRGGDREGSQALLAEFARELGCAVNACARVLAEGRCMRPQATDAVAGMPPLPVLTPLLDRLAAQLDRHSMSAIDTAGQIHALLADTVCGPPAGGIKASLLRLDFAAAARALAGLRDAVIASGEAERGLGAG